MPSIIQSRGTSLLQIKPILIFWCTCIQSCRQMYRLISSKDVLKQIFLYNISQIDRTYSHNRLEYVLDLLEKKEEIWLSSKKPLYPKNEVCSMCNWRLFIPSQQRWRGYSNAAIRGWLGEWVGAWVGGCVRMCVRHTLTCGHYSDYSFCPITFKLHM